MEKDSYSHENPFFLLYGFRQGAGHAGIDTFISGGEGHPAGKWGMQDQNPGLLAFSTLCSASGLDLWGTVLFSRTEVILSYRRQ